MRKKLKTNVNYTKIMGFDFSCLTYVMTILKISRQNKKFPSSHHHIQDMKKKEFVTMYYANGILAMYIIHTC